MKLFEYEVVTLTGSCDLRSTIVNQMALAGWRLILVESGMAYFERERNQDE